MRNLLPLAVLGALSCGGDPARTTTETPSEPPALTSAPMDTVGSPPPPPPPPPADATAKAPGGALRWKDFPGPKLLPPTKGPNAWIAGPVQNAAWTDSLALFRVDVLRVEGQELVVKGVNGEVYVPGAFVAAASASKTLKKGDAVLAQSDASMVAGARYTRIDAIEKLGDDVVYKVQVPFGDDLMAEEMAPANVLPLTGAVGFGAPVAWKDGDSWARGEYVGPGVDKDSAWILGFAGKTKQVKGVKPLTVNKVFKKGDKVWADRLGHLGPATIVSVQAGGVTYKVKYAKDATGSESEDTVGLDRVTTPF